ncbi:hypothetical protein TNCT_263551 [Trichonephila clavata]|uniref:Uncharacterized protein n=1 Tax=Trichonephila clavata TaxID=2740835 RepID=A0A8X6GA29_TRICU|nr:hypothetical protein TNCT_263551 [Trichonephila clavata]
MESSGDVFKHPFDYSDQKSTQFLHDTLTENTAIPSSSQLSGYKHEPLNRYHLNPASDTKELPLSLKPDQKEIYRLDRNSQTNRSQSLMSTECNPMEIYTYGMNEQFNRNLSSTSEYSQMQYFGHGNIEQISIKQSLPSSGLKEM